MRHLSPSLSIYKFPLPAISSISHRISGMYISIFFISTVSYNFIDNYYKNKIEAFYYNMNYNLQKSINYCILYPFGFHTVAGIRHLIWDNYPLFLTKSSVYKSSKFLFFSAIIPTFIFEKKINNYLY